MNRTLIHALVAMLFLSSMTAAAATRLQPESVQYNWSTGPYTYDGSGNIVAIGPHVTGEGTGATDYYVYDAVGRLRNGTAHTASSSNQQTFTYDVYGNLLQIDTTTTPGGTASATYALNAATNQLSDSTQCATGTTCFSATYDPNTGNQLTSSSGIASQWDTLGMMNALDAGARHEWYVYDANNERVLIVKRAPSSTAETRVYSMRGPDAKVQREIVDQVSNGHHWSWQKDYVYAGSRLITSIIPEAAGEARRHFHPDHLGTPLLITDDRGFRLSLHKYFPFGAEAPGSDSDTERMKFTGHERDFGAGPGQDLDYMHARYYTPVMGRFLSVDPAPADKAAPQSWNRYTYVRNNPINKVDPDGREELDVCDAYGNCRRLSTTRSDKVRREAELSERQLRGSVSGSLVVNIGNWSLRVTIDGNGKATGTLSARGKTMLGESVSLVRASSDPSDVQGSHAGPGDSTAISYGPVSITNDGTVRIGPGYELSKLVSARLTANLNPLQMIEGYARTANAWANSTDAAYEIDEATTGTADLDRYLLEQAQ